MWHVSFNIVGNQKVLNNQKHILITLVIRELNVVENINSKYMF